MDDTVENATEPITRDSGKYEVVITEVLSHWLAFRVYEVLGTTDDGERVYNRAGYLSSPDPANSRDGAQVFLSGSIKWDGCADISMDDQPLHFCQRSHAEELGTLLTFLYDLADELVPSFEG